jgi:hypothetical protein
VLPVAKKVTFVEAEADEYIPFQESTEETPSRARAPETEGPYFILVLQLLEVDAGRGPPRNRHQMTRGEHANQPVRRRMRKSVPRIAAANRVEDTLLDQYPPPVLAGRRGSRGLNPVPSARSILGEVALEVNCRSLRMCARSARMHRLARTHQTGKGE